MELNEGVLDELSCQLDNLANLERRGLVKRTVKLLLDTNWGCKINLLSLCCLQQTNKIKPLTKYLITQLHKYLKHIYCEKF